MKYVYAHVMYGAGMRSLLHNPLMRKWLNIHAKRLARIARPNINRSRHSKQHLQDTLKARVLTAQWKRKDRLAIELSTNTPYAAEREFRAKNPDFALTKALMTLPGARVNMRNVSHTRRLIKRKGSRADVVAYDRAFSDAVRFGLEQRGGRDVVNVARLERERFGRGGREVGRG